MPRVTARGTWARASWHKEIAWLSKYLGSSRTRASARLTLKGHSWERERLNIINLVGIAHSKRVPWSRTRTKYCSSRHNESYVILASAPGMKSVNSAWKPRPTPILAKYPVFTHYIELVVLIHLEKRSVTFIQSGFFKCCAIPRFTLISLPQGFALNMSFCVIPRVFTWPTNLQLSYTTAVGLVREYLLRHCVNQVSAPLFPWCSSFLLKPSAEKYLEAP